MFAAVVGAAWVVRPRCMFHEDGSLRRFGAGPDESVFSFGVLVAVTAILSSYAFAMGDLVALGGGGPSPGSPAPEAATMLMQPPTPQPSAVPRCSASAADSFPLMRLSSAPQPPRARLMDVEELERRLRF
jgi:hypothetical protein